MALFSNLMLYDTFSNRPSAGIGGRIFYASDTGALYRDNGASWDQLKPVPAVTLGSTVSMAANQSATSGSFTIIQFTATGDNGLAAANLGAHSTRLTAPTTGYYILGAHVTFSANASGHRIVFFEVNGSTNYYIDAKRGLDTGSSEFALSGVLQLTAADYVELSTYQDSGSTLQINPASFTMARMP